ncbi:UNKNOWN [Stylonychia lemnae]|uniref:Uncharacterized protein n=1 Tax=Stylonychia lemnae TaxID=5949 RepID=A0A078A7X7_STYLE|nr:UNKNOWN [Stylonychia lemnae]|eukprot:CDW77956.1 UNKNOWN [Stylonychia lemnae]
MKLNKEYWERNDSRNEWGDDDSQDSPSDRIKKQQSEEQKMNQQKQSSQNEPTIEVQQNIDSSNKSNKDEQIIKK